MCVCSSIHFTILKVTELTKIINLQYKTLFGEITLHLMLLKNVQAIVYQQTSNKKRQSKTRMTKKKKKKQQQQL